MYNFSGQGHGYEYHLSGYILDFPPLQPADAEAVAAKTIKTIIITNNKHINQTIHKHKHKTNNVEAVAAFAGRVRELSGTAEVKWEESRECKRGSV